MLQLVLFALHSSADCVPGVGGCRAALANGRVDAYAVKFIPQAVAGGVLWATGNTMAVPVISSIGLQWAWVSADKGDADGVKKGLYLGGVLAFAFLTGQLLVWQQLVVLGFYASSNPASAFFYLFTALHAVHLLGGLVAWGRTATKVKSGMDVAKVRGSFELCAVYWHFLLVIWIVIFGLLLFT